MDNPESIGALSPRRRKVLDFRDHLKKMSEGLAVHVANGHFDMNMGVYLRADSSAIYCGCTTYIVGVSGQHEHGVKAVELFQAGKAVFPGLLEQKAREYSLVHGLSLPELLGDDSCVQYANKLAIQSTLFALHYAERLAHHMYHPALHERVGAHLACLQGADVSHAPETLTGPCLELSVFRKMYANIINRYLGSPEHCNGPKLVV